MYNISVLLKLPGIVSGNCSSIIYKGDCFCLNQYPGEFANTMSTPGT